VGEVERELEVRDRAGVGARRREDVRVLALDRRVARAEDRCAAPATPPARNSRLRTSDMSGTLGRPRLVFERVRRSGERRSLSCAPAAAVTIAGMAHIKAVPDIDPFDDGGFDDPLGESWPLAEPADRRPWPFRRLPLRSARVAALATIAILAAASVVLVSGARVSRQDSGHVGIVRNGGPVDNRAIRQVLMPGQRVSWIGLFSQPPREYPASKVVLFYTITGDASRGNRREVDVVTVPTRDGVQVGVEGTVFFHFVGESDTALLRRFDQTFGTRKFPVAGTNDKLSPWDGDAGFAAMLDTTFRPILDNNLRAEVGAFDCAALIASCTLVHRVTTVSARQRSVAAANIAAVETRISNALGRELSATLGGDYFRAIRVRIGRVTLPEKVQTAVDEVQSQYVAINGARAEVRRARYDAKRNELRARAYNDSPALAQIDAIRAAPKGATIVLTGAGKGSKQPGINVGG
jgi:regulator of protease activity HflC (stomatin/prohibitin superfamily)